MLACMLLSVVAALPERGEACFRPTEAEAAVPEPFRLGEATFAYTLEPLRETAGYDVLALRFPSPVESPDPVNNTVYAEYFRPKGATRCPAVVVLHILGADFALSRFMAARLADRGVAALFVQLPYYGERRPPGRGKRLLSSAEIERTVLAMRQGICDVRRAAGWLAGRAEVDPGRIGVAGISLGGIVSAVVAAVDPAVGSAALLLAGGNLHDILWTMPEGAAFRRAWVDSGRTLGDLEALTRPFDPLTYAEGLRGKRVLMLAGNVDEVVPPRDARALWEAAGRPPIEWLDCGHYSAAAFLLPALRRTAAFFADWPAGPAPGP